MTTMGNSENPQRFLDATTHTVAWFWNRLRDQTLNMKPPYQRNPVWQEMQKAYLIDTILRGYPVPELYLQTIVNAKGEEQHIVVDGQQRIRACLEFLNNDFTLGYSSDDYAGLTFEELDDDAKKRIFGYTFVIRSLPDLSDAQLREIFGRLNLNNVALNRQELRNATYWGEFITSMTKLSQIPFWISSGLFTSNDVRRMLDIEYISELATAFLFGPQNKKARLDDYYYDFEEEFPDKERVESAFAVVLSELAGIFKWPTGLRWSRKVDFYTLFLVLAERVDEMPFDRDQRNVLNSRLTEFSQAVSSILSLGEEDREGVSYPKAAVAYSRGVRNSSDLNSRRMRSGALASFLQGIEYASSERHVQDPLSGLPDPHDLMQVVEEESVEDEDET
jgi:hypothetical protein